MSSKKEFRRNSRNSFFFCPSITQLFWDKDNAGLNINPHGASAHTSRLTMVRKYGLGTPKMAQRKNEGAIIDFNGRKNTAQTKPCKWRKRSCGACYREKKGFTSR
jgi:hypothetical protein